MWHHPLPLDIIAALISDKNNGGTLTNSDLELAALVLPKATLLDVCPDATMAAPCSGLDNTPTVYWSTWEAFTINLVVADLLRIRALHLKHSPLNPSVFYHPGQENRMADGAPHLFDISDTPFLAHMSAAYLQPQIFWQLCLPQQQLISCVISTLCRKLCNRELLRMHGRRGYTVSGSTSAPPYW